MKVFLPVVVLALQSLARVASTPTAKTLEIGALQQFQDGKRPLPVNPAMESGNLGWAKEGEECKYDYDCLDASNVCYNSVTCRKLNDQNQTDCQSRSLSSEFVQRCGNELYFDGAPFRFLSFNIPNLLMLEDRRGGPVFRGMLICRLPVTAPSFDSDGYAFGVEDGAPCIVPKPSDFPVARTDSQWISPTRQEQEDALLSIKGLYGKVVRTYTLGIGPSYHVTGPNTFNETAWVAFDNALDVARIHNVKLMVPLINHFWSTNPNPFDYFGNFALLAQFRNVSPTHFYSDPVLRQDVKDIITYMLNRRNTLNGVRYGDDPTLFVLELGNELGGWSDSPPPADWTIEMSTHIKTLAPNLLVADGTFGGLNLTTRLAPSVLQSDSVDIFTNHYYYGLQDVVNTTAILLDAKFVAQKNRKVFLVGELGFKKEIIFSAMRAMLENKGISGVLPWSLRFHSSDSGFYTHSEIDGVYAYHCPGFNQSAGFGADDFIMAKTVRSLSLELAGMDPQTTAYPLPQPVKPAAGILYSALAIKWMGSAWAASYEVNRVCGDGQVQVVAVGIQDNLPDGSILYGDTQAHSDNLNNCTYLVFPSSVDGRVNRENTVPLIIYS